VNPFATGVGIYALVVGPLDVLKPPLDEDTLERTPKFCIERYCDVLMPIRIEGREVASRFDAAIDR
jgi:hypothetical protein